MRLIVVRHAETIENKNKIHQGHMDGTLSEEGIKQAQKVGLRFKDEKIDAIYTSDLGRTVDTAKEIMKYHPNLELKLDKGLRERHIKCLSGKTGVPKDFNFDYPPCGSENRDEMMLRFRTFLNDMLSKYKDKTILVVTHAAPTVLFLLMAYNKPQSEFESLWGIKNTAVSIFDIEEDGNHKVHLVNCTKHLEE
ncbi:MAG: histidine phosphatase family protein [Nanoarchaeota archaeon]|nr:histidine phosphatase family protein [Nanoarchaeota archaeon]